MNDPTQPSDARQADIVRIQKETSFLQGCFVSSLDMILAKETVMGMPYDAEKRMQWIRENLSSLKAKNEKLLRAHERQFPD